MKANDSTTPVARWRRVLAFLRHPWCGGVALAFLAASTILVLYVPKPVNHHSVVGDYFNNVARPFYDAWVLEQVVELRPEGTMFSDPLSRSWDGLEARTRDATHPVYFVSSNHSIHATGFWLPWRRIECWNIECEPLVPIQSPMTLMHAREAFFDYAARSSSEPLPPELGRHDVRRETVFWVSFALNISTLFAAWVFIWSLSGVPAWWRERHARIAATKQVCAGCGYSLAGLGVSATCPECGRAHPA